MKPTKSRLGDAIRCVSEEAEEREPMDSEKKSDAIEKIHRLLNLDTRPPPPPSGKKKSIVIFHHHHTPNSAKQLFVQRTLTDLGPEALEERLQSALMAPPASPAGSHALSAAVDACLRERGAPALLVEVDIDVGGPSGGGGDPVAPVVKRATELAEAGADAIVLVAPAVARARKNVASSRGGGAAAAAAPSPLPRGGGGKEDEEADAAATLACLLSVSRSLAANPKFRLGAGDVSEAIAAGSSSQSSVPPVLLRDWIVHPLQLADVKAAGGSGALGAAAAVLGKGGPVLTSFGVAMGLDVPLEVVNAAESRQATDGGNGVPIVAVNVSLALSISIASIAGAAGAVAEGILGDLPPGCFAVVGCDSLRAVAEAARAGAAAVVVKEGAWEDALRPQGSFQENSVAGAMEELRSAASLSD